jgi:hypothetical protein
MTLSANPYQPLQAPDESIKKFENITDYNRRKFAGNFFVTRYSVIFNSLVTFL